MGLTNVIKKFNIYFSYGQLQTHYFAEIIMRVPENFYIKTTSQTPLGSPARYPHLQYPEGGNHDATLNHTLQDFVESGTGTHGGLHFARIRVIIPADILTPPLRGFDLFKNGIDF